MARRTTEQWLARVAALRAEPVDAAQLRAELGELLASAQGAAVAAAARLGAERGLGELEGELADAFARLLEEPLRRDPQCVGKRALARALIDLDCRGAGPYESGSRHVQLEPVLGGKVDTAAELRALCAQGLVLATSPRLWSTLADLLADPEPEARAGAVRAIALAGNPYLGVPLLRLRVRCGDRDARVLGDCLQALLQLAPEDALELVAEHLEHAEIAIAESAALALGESRAAGALDVLRGWLERVVDAERRSAGYLALALLRSDEALACLLEKLREVSVQDAALLLQALAIQREDGALRGRIEQVLTTRGEPALRAAFARAFG